MTYATYTQNYQLPGSLPLQLPGVGTKK
jgi:hypothetical protein